MKLITAIALLAPLASGFPASSPDVQSEPRGPVNYDGYHVYSITAADRREAADLENRFARHHTQTSRNEFEVAIPPHEIRTFNELGLDARLLSEDLGKQIRDADRPATFERSLQKRDELPDESWFDSYHSYDDHLQYWDDLVAAFPNNSEKFDLGASYEGRSIFAFNFWGSEENKGSKPVILWHATVHAREWISTMVIEYLARTLIEGYNSGDEEITSFLDRYDFWLVPFHNPDGFVYTQTTDRMWRKNRQPRRNTTCLGTDGNRNWNFQWYAEPPEGGSSPDPCTQTYRGQCPGDTPENQAISALSKSLGASPGGIRSYIDFHSYGHLVLTPWGFSCEPEVLPPSLPRMVEVAKGFAGGIASVNGTEYEAGPGCEILYFSTGNSRDFHHGANGANHSWTVELSPQNAREGGFVLPPARIWQVVKEQWAGQQYLLNEIWDE